MKLTIPHRNLEIHWEPTNNIPWIDPELMDEWEKKLFDFLEEWSNESDTLTAQTSGSTGIPKKIQLEKEKMINSAKMTIDHFKLADHQTALLCMSVDFIAGKMMVVRSIVGHLNLIAVAPSSSPLSIIMDRKIDFAAMVPLQASASLKQLNNVKQLIIGGGVVNHTLRGDLQKLTTRCWSTYGMTETITHIALKPLNGSEQSEYYTVLPKVRFSVDDRGCLVINAPHLTNTTITTNDRVEQIDNSSFIWLGRWDNIINSGGIKISPEEIESKIQSYLKHNFFVAGISDEKLESKLVLIIEDKEWTKENKNNLLKRLNLELPKYKSPRDILFTREFSYTISNKVKRGETLKKLLNNKL